MATKIILNKDVATLGEEGDVKVVADGYARNYLFPQDLAVPYSKHWVNVFESKRAAIEKRKEEKRQAARGLKERIEEEHLEIEMPAGESGKLFGSVTNTTVDEHLEKIGINVDKKRIDVPDNTIKMIGDYTVTIKLYGGEEAELKVTVKPQENK
ncbi:MAG: 50S ribosomal protein L9 [Spirochaetia bacterium]